MQATNKKYLKPKDIKKRIMEYHQKHYKVKTKLDYEEFFEELDKRLEPLKKDLEKIKYALMNKEIKESEGIQLKKSYPGVKDKSLKKDGTPKKPPATKLYDAIFKGHTEKAVLLEIDGIEMWIPNGCIMSEIDRHMDAEQEIVIQKWFISKKKEELNL